MDETLDLRVQKTYESLITALFELLQERPLEKITVNELCKKARIRRPTFYKHFNDKYDFFKFAIHTLQKKQILRVDEVAYDKNPLDYFLTWFQVMVKAVNEYQKVLLSLHIDSPILFLSDFLGNYMEEQIAKRWQHFVDEGKLTADNMDFNIQIMLGMFKQIGLWWLKNQEKISQKEVVEKMAQVLSVFFSKRA